MSKFGKKHALEGVELSLLLGTKIIEIGIIDDIKTTGKLGLVLIVAFSLFPQFQKCFLNFDIRQGIDLAKLVDAYIRHLVLSSDVGKLVYNPGSLMIATEGIRTIAHIAIALG